MIKVYSQVAYNHLRTEEEVEFRPLYRVVLNDLILYESNFAHEAIQWAIDLISEKPKDKKVARFFS